MYTTKQQQQLANLDKKRLEVNEFAEKCFREFACKLEYHCYRYTTKLVFVKLIP